MTEEKRGEQRIALRLKAAVVYHEHADTATRPTYHGLTCDISMSGLSVVMDHNVFHEGEVTILLAIPPAHPGGRQKIVEATAKMVHTVHSSEHSTFRIGMMFKTFRRDGKKLLKEAIERRSVTYHY